MKIVALDFETANRSRFSACSLGIAIYENNKITDSFEWLIKPPKEYSYFIFTYLHNISYKDVKDEEYFSYYYDDLKDILSNAIITAHNALFDLNVLNGLCDYYKLERFHNYYLDTLKLSRRYYPRLYNHKLNTICDYLNIDLNHHNGKSDALGCLKILLNILDICECKNKEDITKKMKAYMKINK